MELLITYSIVHVCLVAVSWLTTHAENRPISPPTRYLGGKIISAEIAIAPRKNRFWF
ncbi:hypothetical protein [Scytonema millei]|uniref:Uncharacterized protein n=1 Tax=Scytonema millei VB511283 TaxID=1245923 RepID=A0A9X5E9Q0_9CYAN|nr:hypothetical protein [Scytonema millei]NHC37822.1 hypothetical protein [Scytonema millei VB511283]